MQESQENQKLKSTRCRLCTALLFCAFLAGTPPAFAKSKIGPSEPLLQADHISYDEKANTITAQGHVEVALGDQIIRADQIIYNKGTDVIKAVGHVAATQSSGEILYTKEIEITSDMREAFLDRVGVLFPDSSRLVAKDATRYEGRYLITRRAIYTACNLCEKDPTRPPIWQVKGERVTHDSQEKRVIYRDATIEFAGIPVFYTPYFSHPDASVKRQQGFLAPTAFNSQTLGFSLSTPYYIDFQPNSDLVIAPTFSEEDKLQLALDFRHRFTKGSMRWQGSFAHTDFINEDGVDKGYLWRGHLFGTTRFDLTDSWRAGTDVAFSSDKSYLQRYKISSEDLLVNRAYVENFTGRNYLVGNMYYFQDMRPGITQQEPFVAPEIFYTAYGAPNETFGGRWSLGGSLLVTTRDNNVDIEEQGTNMRRLSLDAGWERQLVSTTGFLTTLSIQSRADGYWAEHVRLDDSSNEFSQVTRIRPFVQGDISVRYPMGRRGDGYQQILEPIAVLSIAPRVKQESLYPNEDSLDVEFDETNLFSTNRFSGVDRVEGGTRLAYGLRHTLTRDNGGKIEMIGGQIFRTKKDQTFPDGSGLADTFSDYVGRINIMPSRYFSANYGFRLSQEDFTFARQQITTSFGVPVFNASLRYLFSRETETSTTTIEQLEEVSGSISSHFSKYWYLTAAHSHAFKPDPGPRTTSVSLSYKDECFEAALTGSREYTDRADIDSGTSVVFRFFMKNIGGWGSD